MGNYQIETSARYNQPTRHNLLHGGKLAGYVQGKAACSNYYIPACLDQCWWSQLAHQLNLPFYYLSK